MRRLVLETAIGPVLPLLLGKLRAARWDSAGATAEGTQDPAPNRAAGQGLATPPDGAAAPNTTLASQARPLPRRGSWGGLRTRPCLLRAINRRLPWVKAKRRESGPPQICCRSDQADGWLSFRCRLDQLPSDGPLPEVLQARSSWARAPRERHGA